MTTAAGALCLLLAVLAVSAGTATAYASMLSASDFADTACSFLDRVFSANGTLAIASAAGVAWRNAGTPVAALYVLLPALLRLELLQLTFNYATVAVPRLLDLLMPNVLPRMAWNVFDGALMLTASMRRSFMQLAQLLFLLSYLVPSEQV